MITFDKSLQFVSKNTARLSSVNIEVIESVDRVLAQDVFSPVDLPPFNKSAVDGYGVKVKDTAHVPVQLKRVGFIEAGQHYRRTIKQGECVKIMTGAPVPKGVEAIVMIEDTSVDNRSWVTVKKHVSKGKNICRCGEDVQKGQTVLRKGSIIRGPEILLLSGLGKKTVRVYRKPKIAILNTGGEVVEPGKKVGKNKIYNSNGPLLVSLCKRKGLTANYLGIVEDREEKLSESIREGLRDDVLIITGGVSMGDYDLVPHILRKSGVKIVFHKVRMKPGQPFLFGISKNGIVFGLPGNPVATFLTFNLFIKPAIDKMKGMTWYKPKFLKGILGRNFCHNPGRKHFVKAVIKPSKEGLAKIYPVKGHGSGDVVSLTKVNGFMAIDENVSKLEKGMKADYILWTEESIQSI
ncbi:MAG: molybdopterin molybdotransferase MoeA [Candidatus Omnitrophica bacterium]|nr:molybdopterin molybdotransferase MoeA [Candidatus Omnitrophota bacterium]